MLKMDEKSKKGYSPNSNRMERFLQYLDRMNISHNCGLCNKSDPHNPNQQGFIFCKEWKHYVDPKHPGCDFFMSNEVFLHEFDID